MPHDASRCRQGAGLPIERASAGDALGVYTKTAPPAALSPPPTDKTKIRPSGKHRLRLHTPNGTKHKHNRYTLCKPYRRVTKNTINGITKDMG